VLTIGTFGAATEPTVSIDGVTITKGVARSSPESVPFVGREGVVALGGGVEIPANADFSGGATVTITNSVITGNRVAPVKALPLGPPCPGNRKCPFALAAGGGIDNWGKLTLRNSTVSHNRVGTASGLSNVASDAYSGAIMNWRDALTISNSVIDGNSATATAPNGRFADSGAIFVEGGALLMRDSAVTGNRAALAAALPNSVDLLAIAGGIHISDRAAGTIRDTTISGNQVSATNTVGNATAFSGGIHTDVDFVLSNDIITGNSVRSAALPGSSGNAQGDSGAGEMGGTISNTRFTGNSVTVSSAAGDAAASAGAAIFAGSMSYSVVSGNHVRAFSPLGTVSVLGGGLQAGGGGLTLRNTPVSANTGYARGRRGYARGGGIFDAPTTNGPPAGPLRLANSSVTHNALSRSPAIRLQGGGVYTTELVTRINSSIRRNSPDQCYGCRTAASATQSAGGPSQRTIGRPTFPTTLLDWLPTDAYRGLR